MPELSAVETGALREFARVLRDAAILDEAREAVSPVIDAGFTRLAKTNHAPALEAVEAELAKRFDNRWVP